MEQSKIYGEIIQKHRLRLFILALTVFILGATHKVMMAFLGPVSLMAVTWLSLDWAEGENTWFKKIVLLLSAAGWIACFSMIMISKKYGISLQLGAAGWISFFCALTFARIFLKKINWNAFLIFSGIFFLAAVVLVLGYADFPRTLLRGRPYANYLRSFFIAFTHTARYHIQCIGGSFVECDWRYFSTIIFAKTSLYSLSLAALGTIGLLISPHKLRDKALALLPALAFWFVASFVNKIHIGLRHVLPVYPFIYLAAGACVPFALNLKNKFLRAVLLAAICSSVIFISSRAVRTAPHYLSYFNETVGGAEEGAKITLDSNIEWGQDNRALFKILKELGNPPLKIAVWSFNSAEYDYYKIPWAGMTDVDFTNPRPGYYAMDIQTYTGEQSKQNSWFRGRAPFRKAGSTIYLFRA